MKKILTFCLFVASTVCLFAQKYSIQENNILIIFKDDNKVNEQLVERLLVDSLLTKDCRSMLIAVGSETLPSSLFNIDWIEDLQINIDDTT